MGLVVYSRVEIKLMGEVKTGKMDCGAVFGFSFSPFRPFSPLFLGFNA